MRAASLIRTETSDEGTFGILRAAGFTCFTAELPWRGNRTGRSSIPAGVYECEYWSSKRWPSAYHIKNVPDRVAILIHNGNFAGDVEKGLRSHVLGCILVGKTIARINGQKGVTHSKPTFEEFKRYWGREPFTLTIEEKYNVS